MSNARISPVRPRPRQPRIVPKSEGKPVSLNPLAPQNPIVGPKANAWQIVALGMLLAAATFGIYFRAIGNPFVNYDDQGYVVDNLHVQQGLKLPTLRWALTSTEADNWHPLTWMSHALDCQLFGLNAQGHHATSVLIHVLNVLLLFLLLERSTQTRWQSFIVAALFALHPINVESVAWVAERKNVLSTLFFLLAIAAYGWYAKQPRIPRYVVVAALFAMGLAAKPMTVTLPFVLVLLDFWPLQRVLALPASQAYPVPQFPWGRLVIEKLPLLALSAASCVITIVAQRTAIAPNQNLPLLARFLNAVYAYSAYIWKALWPAHLASFYPYEGFRLTGWQFLLSLALLAGISFWTWRERFRPYLVVGWLWFLGTLVPVIGLVQVGEQAMADRYAYVPLLGIFVMIVWGVSDLAANWRLNRRMIAAAVALILAVLSSLTWRQTGFWHSSYDLWAHALRVTKDNSVAEDYVGSTLLLNDYEATGQRASEPAMVHFQNAARINPRDPIAHLNIGADLHEHGRLPEAAEQYQLVLQLTRDPHLLSKSLIDLGAVNTQMGNYSAARQYYLDALKLEPGNQAAFMNIGKLGMEERIEELSVAASHSPTKDAYFQLGQVQQLAGRTAAARESFQSALKLDPGFAKAQAALSLLSK